MMLAREISLIKYDRHLCANTFKLLPPNGQIILFGKVPLTLLLLLNARCLNQALTGTATSNGEPFTRYADVHSSYTRLLSTTCYLFLSS